MNCMSMLRFLRASLILILSGSFLNVAQDPPPTGTLEVSGRVRIDGKQEKLTHKRFYLLRGGLEENKSLLDRIRNAEITSRDCYYSRVGASPPFICWLQAENCDSPYCRTIEMSDIESVPEFKAAFQKGLTQFGRKPDIARMWLTTNLAPAISGGYRREQRSLLAKLLAGIKPVQSSMTDGIEAKSIFIDIPVNSAAEGQSEKFTVSNIWPIEFGGKSYVWSCEVNISPEKPASLRLQVPENNEPVKNCEVVLKDLATCNSGECGQK